MLKALFVGQQFEALLYRRSSCSKYFVKFRVERPIWHCAKENNICLYYNVCKCVAIFLRALHICFPPAFANKDGGPRGTTFPKYFMHPRGKAWMSESTRSALSECQAASMPFSDKCVPSSPKFAVYINANLFIHSCPSLFSKFDSKLSNTLI